MRRWTRRTALVVAFALMLAAPASAFAWSNGAQNGNGFGTHDWVLYHAAHIASREGAGWLNKKIALPHTDDPDMIFNDRTDHNYDRWNGEHWGNAHLRVAHWYALTVKYLKKGDTRRASYAMGIMSHYYADVCEPLHTEESRLENAGNLALYHGPYEHAVDIWTHKASKNIKWIHPDGYQHVSNAKLFTVAAATNAHKYYNTLLGEMVRHGMDKKVRTITGRQLNFAVNGLADLIVSAQEDAAQRGVSPQLSADTGVATDGSRYFVTGRTRIEALDASWHSVAATENAADGIAALTDPVLGSPAYLNGRLYVPVSNSDGSEPQVLVFDTGTLTRVDAFPVTEAGRSTCAVAMPALGAHGTLYVASASSSNRFFRYDLSTHAYLGVFKFKSGLDGQITGAATRSGKLFVATSLSPDRGNVYGVDGHGRVSIVYTSSLSGQHGGMTFKKGDLYWLVANGVGTGHVYRLHLLVK